MGWEFYRSMRRAILFLVLFAILLAVALIGLPTLAARTYGPPAASLSFPQVFQYSVRLLWDDGLLTKPFDPTAPEQTFTVRQGETVPSIAERLRATGLIGEPNMFRDYLIYTGLDTTLQAGDYKLNPAMSIVDMARKMQDATPEDVTFVVLPGWRIEEIAASLPTSGLDITPDDFLAAAAAPHPGFDFLADAPSTEGFLYPDTYIVPRVATVDQLMDIMLRNFSLHLTVDLREGFDRQGLSVYQAVTLASIVQREAMQEDEAPLIASVYLNRLKIGMKLDADPTVQYALGFNLIQQTWWTSPLSTQDLQVGSLYNTYVYADLPPTPIDSPALNALRAVASPADTPYYYFSARCDGSGYHQFSQTFEEHLQNLCP